MTTLPTPTPEIQLAQLFRERMDFFESRLSTLEFQSRLQTADTEFAQRFDTLIALLTASQPPTAL